MPTTAEAIGLPFEEAIAFFREKVRVPTAHWDDLWKEAHARGFMVAGAATDGLLKDFQEAVQKALSHGTTLAEFRKDFDRIVKTHGWTHTGTPGWRAKIIYETNLSMAYAAGRYAQQTDPDVVRHFPYWQYRHSACRHPRLMHLAWDGLTLRADDPWWDAHYPPNGWHCGCRVNPTSEGGLRRMGKDGPDESPGTFTKPWTNPRTGEVHQVPVGVDPGFDYNVGKAWQAGRAADLPVRAPDVRPGGAPGELTRTDGGKRVRADGSPLPDHIAALKLPPAWTDVRFNADPLGDLLATGKDSKGRRQAVYSEAFVSRQSEAKFARVRELDAKFRSIEGEVERDRAANDPARREHADCLQTIMRTGIRPGSEADTGAKVKAYGATTLLGRHVVEEAGQVRLRYVGKKGVNLDILVPDRETGRMLVERAAQAGPDGQLFPKVSDGSLLKYVHTQDGGDFKTKDFRTALANRIASREVAAHSAPIDEKTYRKSIMDVAKIVSEQLGNTAVIALESYIDPSVFADWRMGSGL